MPTPRSALPLAIFALSALSAAPAAEAPPKAPEPPKPPAAETAKVAREPLRIEVALNGFLEARRRSEVVLDPQAWAAFVVARGPEAGARVKKGDLLLSFETDKIDDEIRDAEAAQELSRLALDGAADDLRWTQETAPLDLATALRAKGQADEDLKTYLDVDGPLAEKSAKKSVEQSRWALEYAAEELRQLEKMYKADEVTEETEEIVLTRARREVDSARFYLDTTTIRSDQAIKTGIPRQKEALTEAAKRQAIALARLTEGVPKAEAKKKLELAKMKADHEKSAKRIEKLRKDREAMTVVSPQDGLVFLGKFNRGRWADPAMLAEELRTGGTITAKKVLVTVADPRPLAVRADVPEKDLSLVRADVEGRAAPPAAPGLRPRVRVEKVSAAPIAPGVFDATIRIELPDDAALLPGMECPVKLVAYSNPAALTVPAAAVFEDETGGDGSRAYVLRDGKPERRAVKVGHRLEGKVEILDGLAEGDEVLLKRPEKEPGPAPVKL